MDLKTVKSADTSRTPGVRVGRGTGSGLGKTCGRGAKGQGARSGTGGKMGFEGGQMPLYRRLPKKGFTNSPFKVTFTILNVRDLKAFEAGETVDLAAAKSKGLVKSKAGNLKILGAGELDRKLIVKANKFSAAARAKIEAAGGKVEEV